MKERLRSGHRKIKRLLGDPGGLLITILVVNEIVNVSLSTIITHAVSRSRGSLIGSISIIPDWALDTFLGLLATTPVVLLFCEMTPKVFGARANQLMASLAAGPITGIYDLMKPVRVTIQQIVRHSSRLFGAQDPAASEINPELSTRTILKESDFLLMIEEGHKEGAIHESELELIKNVFNLDDTTVEEVFTPLTQARTIPMNTTLKSALIAVRGLQYSRIPVTSPDRKRVVGILYSKDLLRARLEHGMMAVTVESIMRKPVFVTPAMRLNTVFRKFKQNKTHMAVVHDGSTERSLGIVTMNDIFDSLFEDFFEDDEEEVTPPIKPPAKSPQKGENR